MGSLSDAVTLKKRKFDVDEYHRLGEAGKPLIPAKAGIHLAAAVSRATTDPNW